MIESSELYSQIIDKLYQVIPAKNVQVANEISNLISGYGSACRHETAKDITEQIYPNTQTESVSLNQVKQ